MKIVGSGVRYRRPHDNGKSRNHEITKETRYDFRVFVFSWLYFSMLKVANLSKEYPAPRGPLAVLAGVSFSLAPGQAAAIMGPSGSGKSSLLYVLGALEPPTSGTVTLDGCNPFALSSDELAAFRNKAIGFVFQDHCLLPQCTVLENVLIPTLVAPAAGDDGKTSALA